MRKAIALDIGGTNTRAALINEGFEIESVVIRPTTLIGKEAFVSSIISIINEAAPDRSGVICIAGGLPGIVTPDGYIADMANIGIKDLDLAGILSKEFGLSCHLRNDAEAAALAEANLGPHKDYRSLYFITISTGVGGALCIDGRLKNSSCESGHTLFEYRGELHEFEHLVSGKFLGRLCAQDGLEGIEGGRDFFRLVREKDPRIQKSYRGWLLLLASYIKMMQQTFEPDIFCLTGGVMKSADAFFDDLKAICPDSRIEPCHFDQEAGLIGAAVYGFQEEGGR